MFSSCTARAGVVVDNNSAAPYSPSSKSFPEKQLKVRHPKTTATRRPHPETPERIAFKIFKSNEALRAEEAVFQLREQLENQQFDVQYEAEQRKPCSPVKNLPKLFPNSTPAQKLAVPEHLVQQSSPHTPPRETIGGAGDSNFADDGISVISQVTLENMARRYDLDNPHKMHRVHSDTTQQPGNTAVETWRHTAAGSPKHKTGLSPVRLHRVNRSHGTMNTKSTLSTQTTEFASVWRRDEQQYWKDITGEKEPDPAEEGVSRFNNKLTDVRKTSRRGGTVSCVGLVWRSWTQFVLPCHQQAHQKCIAFSQLFSF
jgi:hypothetical protein